MLNIVCAIYISKPRFYVSNSLYCRRRGMGLVKTFYILKLTSVHITRKTRILYSLLYTYVRMRSVYTHTVTKTTRVHIYTLHILLTLYYNI